MIDRPLIERLEDAARDEFRLYGYDELMALCAEAAGELRALQIEVDILEKTDVQ